MRWYLVYNSLVWPHVLCPVAVCRGRVWRFTLAVFAVWLVTVSITARTGSSSRWQQSASLQGSYRNLVHKCQFIHTVVLVKLVVVHLGLRLVPSKWRCLHCCIECENVACVRAGLCQWARRYAFNHHGEQCDSQQRRLRGDSGEIQQRGTTWSPSRPGWR